MRHRSKVQVEFFAITKLNRACPASISVDRRNCHEFGSVERFFNFLIPINLIHTFMITDELHSEQTLLVAPEHSAVLHVRFTPESGHVRCNLRCRLWARSGHAWSCACANYFRSVYLPVLVKRQNDLKFHPV